MDEALLSVLTSDVNMEMNIDLTNGLNGTDINTDINRTEQFIDAAYDNLKYDVLKNKIFSDLKVELRQLLQVEVKAFLNEDRGEQVKDDCYISVISNLEKEVFFLRELVKEKNKLLSSFIQSSVNREQHKSPSQQNINNWKSVDVPLGVESVNDSIEVNSISTINERFNVSISTDEDSNCLVSPECLSFDTPLKHLFERKHSTIDQLSNVRKEKHKQYMAFRGEKNVSVNTVNES